MTEDEWLSCPDAVRSLPFVQPLANERQLRLLAAAFCRDMWPLLVDERSRAAVEALEALADGEIDFEKFVTYSEPARLASYQLTVQTRPVKWVQDEARVSASVAVACSAWPHFFGVGTVILHASRTMKKWSRSFHLSRHNQVQACRKRQHQLLADLFGNPFHPVEVDSAWLTSTVVSLADGLYRDRAFDRLPILADALQDAGCDNESVLTHCRSDGPHFRGCWVVDLVTGRR
ncbi:hypothetical protein [Fimbriiglobus ruber]|nr:hypothetical protein [Fimbriiglobus ruber]